VEDSRKILKILTRICYKINNVLLKVRLNRIMNRDLEDKSREVEKNFINTLKFLRSY